MCVCVYIYVCVCASVQVKASVGRGQRHVWVPGAGVTGVFQLSDMVAGDWKGSMCS